MVEVSKNYDASNAVPLVFALHGSGGNALDFKETSGWNKLQDEHNFVAVYINGIDNDWNGGNCCGANVGIVDDISYVRKVFNEIVSSYNVDRSRVFVTGFSSGGIMAYRLGCELSDIVTGIGVGSGSLGVDCLPEHPVSLIHIHGSGDEIVPINGGYASVDNVVFMSAVDSANGFKNASAVEYLVKAGGHVWFDGNASMMWEFLNSHPRV